MGGVNGDGVAKARAWWKSGMAGVWAIAAGTVVVHLATGWRYGFDRDELMALEDARHLAWGYVQYPPMTAFFGWIALKLFGTSLVGFRFFAAVAQAAALVLTGMMAREIGKTVARGEWRVASEGRKTQDPGSDGEPGAPGNESTFGEWAAVVAAGAGVPFCLGAGALMQYISFDYLCWVLVAYGVVKALKPVASGEWHLETRGKQTVSHDVSTADSQQRTAREPQDTGSESEPGAPARQTQDGRVKRPLQSGGEKWWVMVGVGIGLGMLAKYTMAFLAVGVAVGVLSTEARRFLRSGWLWAGVGATLLVMSPNVLWQWRHEFVSADFLQFIHGRDVREGLTDWFLAGQLELTLLAFPLALAGLWFYLVDEDGEPWRAIGWMYVAPLALLLIMRGRDYYLAPAYPMLYAAGAVWMERQWRELKSGRVQGYQGLRVRMATWLKRSLPAVLVMNAVVAGCVALPVMPVNSQWWRWAAKVDTVLPEEIGWPELAATVAKIRDGLPEGERGRVGILAANYGEIGALNLYGEQYGLPHAISGVNSSWERGYGTPAPETVIAVGFKKEFLEGNFASCEVAGHSWNRYGVANEETIEDPDIFVCRGLRGTWEEFWPKVKLFA